MSDQPGQHARDEWQTRLNEAPHRLSVALLELHRSNPWAEYPALEQAINTLVTELWDRGFSQAEIRTAFEEAIADLPRYTAGEEQR